MALFITPGTAIRKQKVSIRRQKAHSGRHPVRLSHLRVVDHPAAARVRPDREVAAREGPGPLAHRGRGGHLLAERLRVHAVHVELLVSRELPADLAREGAAH